MRNPGILLLLAVATACAAKEKSAQPPPEAPARVDKALRERATKFYQAHVDGKYRQAEQFVADDTKEYFYASQKPRYLKFEISKITYSDKFRQAVVVARCDREVTSEMGKMVFSVPEESTWKIEKGRWYWYVDQTQIRTPLGAMRPTPVTPGPPAGPPPAIKPQVTGMQELWKLVTTDKKEVHLPLAGGSTDVMVRNAMRGVVKIKVLAPETPGLEVAAERETIASGYSARITFKYAPPMGAPPVKAVKVEIQVQPTNDAIPIMVFFGDSTGGK
ncbi:MAG TPA: hypothetical protein VF767_06915 [Bryobacteraceae bacterium]